MQKTILSSIFLILFSLGYWSVTDAQEIRTNDQGQKIMVYPDGSWKFLSEVEDELSPDTEMMEKENINGKQARLAAIKMADSAFRHAARLEKQYQEAKLNRILIEEELEDLDELEDASDWNRINNLYIDAKAKESAAKKAYKEAKKYADLTDKMIYMSDKRRAKMLKKLDKESISIQEDVANENHTDSSSVAIDNTTNPNPQEDFMEFEKEEKPKSKKKKRKIKKYDISEDVYFTPPTPECQISFDGIDEFSKKHRRDVAEQIFFTYTNDQMRKFLQGREYITCYGHLTKISGGLRFLTLKFHIASNLAPRSFGNLPKGSILSIQLLDGDIINIRNTKDDPGYFDQHEDAYIYRGIYPLGGKTIRTLKDGEVDKIRVVWGTGYEDYDIYEMDFFKNQLRCLEK